MDALLLGRLHGQPVAALDLGGAQGAPGTGLREEHSALAPAGELGEEPGTGSVRGANLIAWERRAGESLSTIQVSDNSFHIAVQLKDRLYDALTGPMGLTVTEYMMRLKSPGLISMNVVSTLR